MPPPPNAGILALDLPLRPEELIAAWRPATRRLALPLRAPLQPKARVALRMSAVGLGVAATITGRVVSARKQADLFHVEIAPDDARVSALERLVAVASGKPVAYQPRAPRLLATVPAVVYGPAGPTYMTTFAVSENGCGLAWSGRPMPDVGVPMEIRLGAGSQVANLCGEVCWTAPAGRTVGVQFAAGEKNAWTRMIADLKRSGAPPA